MKEVYVLYGRKDFHEGVFDHDGNYFGEAPVLEIYEKFDDALNKLKEYAIEAYNFMKKYGELVVDDCSLDATTEEDVFKDFNCGVETSVRNDVCWYWWDFGESINWQMEAFNVPWGHQVPILPSLHIRKKVINE